MSVVRELEDEFETIAKDMRKLVKLHKKQMKFYSETPVKRERLEEEEEEQKTPVRRKRERVEEGEQVQKSPKKQKNQDTEKVLDFTCEGRLWEDAPCPGGKRSDQKAGILYEKKRRVVCKECKLAYERLKKKQKKESL